MRFTVVAHDPAIWIDPEQGKITIIVDDRLPLVREQGVGGREVKAVDGQMVSLSALRVEIERQVGAEVESEGLVTKKTSLDPNVESRT